MIWTMLAIFLLLAVAGITVLIGIRQRREPARLLRERLVAIDQAYRRNPTPELSLLREEIASSIPALNQLLVSSATISKLQRWIDQAGLRLLVGKFLLLSACLGAALALLLEQMGQFAWFGCLGFLLGSALPPLFVWWKRQQRFARIHALLPDAIDLLTRGVRAGHAFTTCLELIVNESPEPLAGEFRKVYEEQRFGLPIAEALLNLTERIPLLDVRILVTALLLQRETGGNLAEILDKLSGMIRERFKIHRQVRVFTAQGRLSMLVLMALPPLCGIVMSLTEPDLMRVLYTDPIGQDMIATGIVMMMVGYLIIRKVVRIQV